MSSSRTGSYFFIRNEFIFKGTHDYAPLIPAAEKSKQKKPPLWILR